MRVRGSVLAMQVGLQTMGFICPNTSNQGNWDPGTATVLCLSPAAGGNHLVHMCIDTYILSLADHPAHPRRGAG